MKRTFFPLFLAAIVAVTLSDCKNPAQPDPVVPSDAVVPSDTIVTNLAISGVTAPATGASPVTSVDSAQYSGSVAWSPAVTGTFNGATAYTATITLTAKAGYTLVGVAANSFTVAGANSVGNAADSGVVTAVFPATATPPNRTYNLDSSPGVEWSVGSNNCDWQWGTISNIGPVGAVCYGTNISGEYGFNRTFNSNYVQLGPLNLSGYGAAAGFRMVFQAWFQLETGFDFAQLQYSTNGTNFTAVPAGSISGYSYTDGTTWSPNPTVAGHEPAWRSVSVDLGTMGLNGQTTVYFRWALSSDDSTTYSGLYIDDIDIGY